MIRPKRRVINHVDGDPAEVQATRVALLVNFIPPYRLPVYEELSRLMRGLLVLSSVKMEPNRAWQAESGSLNVVYQRTITIRKSWRHPAGFKEDSFVHLPWDTLYLLRRARPATIISGELGVRTIQAAVYKGFNRGVRLVIWATLSERTEIGRGPMRTVVRRVLVRAADAVIVNGQSGRRYIASLGVPDEKIYVCNQVASPQNGAVALVGVRSPRRILHVGQLIARKGVVELVLALSRLPAGQVRLSLAGDGPEREKISELASKVGVVVDFHGEVHPDDLPELLSSSDALVIASLADEWGIVVNEALASGLPVIGSEYAQAVQELVRDGENGLLFRPDDQQSLDHAIMRFLSLSTVQLQDMSVRAAASVVKATPTAYAEGIVGACVGKRNGVHPER